MDISFEMFRHQRAIFLCATHTRPKLLCYVNRASQVTSSTFCKEKIRELNRETKEARRRENTALKYWPLYCSSAHFHAYANASFASNNDLFSQLSFLVFMCDKDDVCPILDFSCKTSEGNARLIVTVNLYGLVDAFDVVMILAHDLRKTLDQEILLSLSTDAEQIFDAILKEKYTTKKRLMIDVGCARQAYKAIEIDSIGLVSSVNNPADSKTKLTPIGALKKNMEIGYDRTAVAQFIDRDKSICWREKEEMYFQPSFW